MNLLLDTHILIWVHTEDRRLSDKAKELLTNKANIIYYSPISIWESEIKLAIRPNDFLFSGKQLNMLCRAADMILLPLQPEHIFALSTLHYSETAPKPHKDPFDRMLICQAKTEGMKFITHDSLIPYYDEECVISI